MMPLMIVVALTVINLARFATACATFDRVALDASVGLGVSPPGEQSSSGAVEKVRTCIEEALDSECCEVEVTTSDSDESSAGEGRVTFAMSPLLTTYRCTLRFRPWPRAFSIAGVSFGAPVCLTHERSITVDRFRPGVAV